MPELSKTNAGAVQRLLSTNEAAKYLGVTATTVRRRVYAGDLPVIRCFKTWKIDRSDLDAFITAQKDVL
jgi:excisionase family DNA binding protein